MCVFACLEVMLFYDGDPLDVKKTPRFYEMEDDFQIDVKVRKKKDCLGNISVIVDDRTRDK